MKSFLMMSNLVFAISLIAMAVGCSGGSDTPAVTASIGGGDATETQANKPTIATPADGGTSPATADAIGNSAAQVNNPVVLFKTSAGNVKVKLNAAKAPITVENFIENYVKREHYTDTIFHYVDRDNLVVGGGFDTEGNLRPTRAEIQSEADNGLMNHQGTIAMARAADFAHTATSQFFFNLKDNSEFDHQSRDSADTFGYCVFGEVTEGMDVLMKIGKMPVSATDISPKQPEQAVVLQSVEILD